MRRIVGAVFVSLDGVMQAPGGPTEDWTGGFKLGGWLPPHFDDTLGDAVGKLFEGEFDLLLGRTTYDIFAAYWPFADKDDPIHVAFEKAAKFVVTRGDQPLEWQGSHRVESIDAIRALKASAGPDLVIQGSGTLYPQLFAAGLIDRLTVMTFPVVLGGGKKLFGEGTPAFAMRMVSNLVSATGVTIATYEPAGEVKTGDFAAQEPNPREIARQERMKREG